MPKSLFSDAYRHMIDVLVEARTDAGVTQAELSARLKKPQPFISKIERGVRRIDVIEFCAIARALKHEPAALFAQVIAKLPARLDI